MAKHIGKQLPTDGYYRTNCIFLERKTSYDNNWIKTSSLFAFIKLKQNMPKTFSSQVRHCLF